MKALEAQYEHGVLRPSENLGLRPGERVDIMVHRRADRSRWDLARLAQLSDEEIALAEQGLDEWSAELDAENRLCGEPSFGGQTLETTDLANRRAVGRL